jgi:hypothetical protein
MIEVLPPLGKYKYETWRILLVKCYTDNSVCLQRCIRNINTSCFSMSTGSAVLVFRLLSLTSIMSHDFEVGILQILPLCLKSGLVAVKAGLASGEG